MRLSVRFDFDAEDIRAKGWIMRFDRGIKWWTLDVSIRPSLPEKRKIHVKARLMCRRTWVAATARARADLRRRTNTNTHMQATTTHQNHIHQTTPNAGIFVFCSSSVYRFHLPTYPFHFHILIDATAPLRRSITTTTKTFVICLIRFRRRCLIRARTRNPSISKKMAKS